MTQATTTEGAKTPGKKIRGNGEDKAEQTKPGAEARQGRAISDPREVAQLVMMRVDHVNSTKDDLTIAVKALADTAKQLAGIYANQQAQIAMLAKQVEELKKAGGK